MGMYSYKLIGCDSTTLVYRFLFDYRGQNFGMDFNCPRLVDMTKATARTVERFHVANCLADFRRRRTQILKDLAAADGAFREAQAKSRRSKFRIVK